jgi:Putative phage tail protein
MSGVWSDAANWATGHWLNGRLEGASLDGLIAELLGDFGIEADRIDVDGFTDGYVISTPSSARAALEPLASLYRFDGIASSGLLRFVSVDPRQITMLTDNDLVPDKDGSLATVILSQESELPREIRLSFSDSEKDYRLATSASRRLAVTSKREVTSDPSVITTRAEAQRLAEQMLTDTWAERQRATFSMRPGLMALEPGDCVSLSSIGHQGVFRITRITDRGVREIEAQTVDTLSVDLAAGASLSTPAQAPQQAGPANVFAVDLPVISGDTPILQALAASANPWPGSLAVWRSPDGISWTNFGVIDRPATTGVTVSALGAGPLWRWDTINSVTVKLASGQFSSPGDFSALAGDVPLALQGADGSWEVIAFAVADLVGDQTWRLSRLIRGIGGSEVNAARVLPAGARVVMLDKALLPIASGAASLGAAWQWRVVASTLDYMHPTAVALTTTAGSAALLPLSVVNATAKRTASGITVSFMRRGRIEADAWGQAEIPLEESAERYEMDIYKNGSVVRTLSVTGTPAILYPSAFETADFGTAQTRISVAIFQIGDAVGRGAALSVTLPVT